MIFWRPFLNRESRDKRSRDIAVSGGNSERRKLAGNKATPPELLYYMAENDIDAGVRRAVAHNFATPVHASSLLARDVDADVRLALAGRLVRLLPDLSNDKHGQLYHFAIQALGLLAIDEVLKIRIALSSALKDHAYAPPKVVGQLARDIEREVSEPVLKFCTALSDDDLLDILKTHPAAWAAQAIAGRTVLSEALSQGVVDRGDIPAGVILMENKGARLSETAMGAIVGKSKDRPEWQRSISLYKNLPGALAVELARFVDAKVRDLLLNRTDMDMKTMAEITDVVRRRIDFMDRADDPEIPAETKIRSLMFEGRLDEDALSDMLAVQDRDMALAALAAMAGTTIANVEKITSLGTSRPVIALSWKAGLSMRMALKLQQELARVPNKELVYPRGGTDYPMDEGDIKWQLEFFGIKP